MITRAERDAEWRMNRRVELAIRKRKWRYGWVASRFETHFYISNDLFIEIMTSEWKYHASD